MVIYNYITTNTLNNKQYVGMHKTDEVDDGYLGSGRLILKAIKKYGKENFTREILYFCPDVSIAHYNEGKYIIQYNTLTPYGYNINPKGGVGGKESAWNKNKTLSKEHKDKIGKNNGSKRKEVRDKIGKSHKGKSSKLKGRKLSIETIDKIRKSNIGKKRTLETRQKISEKSKGNKSRTGLKNSKETRIKASNSLKGKIPWNKGKKYKQKRNRTS